MTQGVVLQAYWFRKCARAQSSHGLHRSGAERTTAVALGLEREDVPLDMRDVYSRPPLRGDKADAGGVKRCLRTAFQTQLTENGADM